MSNRTSHEAEKDKFLADQYLSCMNRVRMYHVSSARPPEGYPLHDGFNFPSDILSSNTSVSDALSEGNRELCSRTSMGLGTSVIRCFSCSDYTTLPSSLPRVGQYNVFLDDFERLIVPLLTVGLSCESRSHSDGFSDLYSSCRICRHRACVSSMR